jgi:hypothetical protein
MPTICQTIQKICLSFLETEQVISHSFPTYKTEGKIFTTFQPTITAMEKSYFYSTLAPIRKRC